MSGHLCVFGFAFYVSPVFSKPCVDTSACLSYMPKATCQGNFVDNALSPVHYFLLRVKLDSLQSFWNIKEMSNLSRTTFRLGETPWNNRRKAVSFFRKPCCFAIGHPRTSARSCTAPCWEDRHSTTPLRQSQLHLPHGNISVITQITVILTIAALTAFEWQPLLAAVT